MPHWDDRKEANWKKFKFNQPYAKGLERLKRDVLGQHGFDPATLWQWGTMQGMALVEVLKSCEKHFGAAGQKVVCDALHRIGLDIGRQVLKGFELPEGMSLGEFWSFYATVINTIVYASLEKPQIDDGDKTTFDILWCPHQDHYQAMDCRVQRYFVQGMIDAVREKLGDAFDANVKFDSTIPSGAHTCHFTVWKPEGEEKQRWELYTKQLEAKALEHAKKA
jgi:hypothetical protein